MSDGFLGRWSRRKLDVREGKPVAPEPSLAPLQPGAAKPAPQGAAASPSTVVPGMAGATAARGAPSTLPSASTPAGPAAATREAPPDLPTLDEAQALTPESDFRPFVQRAVDPRVRNAAMKRLFADPHFNVMDKLDVYVDDYSQPDPLPLALVRQMTGAHLLGLAEEAPADVAARDDADDPTAGSMAQSPSIPTEATAPPPEDADPDLRLQQDDAPGPQGPGAGAQ